MSPDLARLFCRTSVSRDVLLISVHVPMSLHLTQEKGRGGEKLGALGCGTSVTKSLVSGYSRVWLARVNIPRHNGTKWCVARARAWMRRKSRLRNTRTGDCIVPRQIGDRRHTHFHSINPILLIISRVSLQIEIIISRNWRTLKKGEICTILQ